MKGDLIVTINGHRPIALSGLRSMLLGPRGSRVMGLGV
jgi:hypothetical protein